MANIPKMDFRGNKFTNEDGTLTEVAQSFFDLLSNVLIKNIGPEALVAPTQSATNINTIVNNVTTGPTGLTTYTCQFGTIIYDSDTNTTLVCLNNGSGVPVFKTITTS